MKKHILALLAIVFLTSCSNKKTYSYIEVDEEVSLLGGTETKEKEAISIEAENDSIAYLEAYEKFCIALKVNKDMKESLGGLSSIPVQFKLLNDKNIDIANSVSFLDKAKSEKEIQDRINSLKNSIQESVENNKKEELNNFKKNAKVDSIKIKELQKYFRKKHDEFSKDNKTWYEPKSAPSYTNQNGMYCYFQVENGMPSNLRLRMQYYSDDWLFINKIQFSIDGKAYEYIPSKMETDSGDGGNIWEWFDENLTASDRELIYALANAKTAKMKLLGRQYFDIKKITNDQILNIKRSLEYYNAMGGNY